MDYPAVLTNKEWQKSKGLIAKIVVGKTDVGANLTALETAFKKSDFAKAATPFDKSDPTEFKVFIKSVKTGLDKQAGEIGAKVTDAVKVASQAAGDMKGNSKVPASVTKYLSSMIAALGKFGDEIKAQPDKIVTSLTDDFKKKLAADPFYKALKDSCGKVETKWKALLGDIKLVEADPKIATVDKVFSGDNNARGITTAAKFWDQVLIKKFPTTAGEIYSGSAMNDYYSLPGFPEIADQKGAVTLKALMEKSAMAEDRLVTTFMLKFSSSVVKSHELVNHIKFVLNACESAL